MSASVLPEHLDEIIEDLRDDRLSLLALGLVSKQTLAKSRNYLFSNVDFDGNDRHFDAFLALLDAPWSSFTSAIESLHIKDLFHPTKRYTYRPRNMTRIAANLMHLKTIWVTSISWLCIPSHVRDFFQMNIADLQLDSVEFCENDLVELFSILQPSLERITTYNLQYDEIHDLPGTSSIFQRRFCFTSLDCSSLVLFKDVWDPPATKDLDVRVESFHLRLLSLTSTERELYTPFISKFLQHVGPSLRRLFINLSDPYFDPGKLFQVLPMSSDDLFQRLCLITNLWTSRNALICVLSTLEPSPWIT